MNPHSDQPPTPVTSRLSSAVQFCFGEVRHTRLRPIRNAFCYRAFFWRVAMHEVSGQRRGNLLVGINRWALLSLFERDHGDGGTSVNWLESILGQSSLPIPTRLWLHAFPRMFGYAFKPVSFWFCHDRNDDLYAIVAEVHNTFGERHCYLLSHPDGRRLKAGETLTADKAFHVSPFCEVKGHYRFRFMEAGDRSCARIDYDDSQGPLLLTSLSGRLRPCSTSAALSALLGYPFFTLGVVARIHWQALRLWIKKLPLHRKPPAPQELVTRGLNQ